MHSLYNTKRVVRNIVLQVSFIGDLHQEGRIRARNIRTRMLHDLTARKLKNGIRPVDRRTT